MRGAGLYIKADPCAFGLCHDQTDASRRVNAQPFMLDEGLEVLKHGGAGNNDL